MNRIPDTRRSTLASLFLLFAIAAPFAGACSDDDTPMGPAAATPAPTTTSVLPADAAPDRGPSGPELANVVAYDATKFELPEALVVRDGFAYVSLAPKGQIERVELATGARSLFTQLPVQPSNFALGSELDEDGNLYVAVGATNPADTAGVAAAGVYKVDRAGRATLFASSPTGFKFANGLAFAPDGQLFVTDAIEGAIYRIPPTGAVGTATPWKTDPALTGDQAACPGTVASFPIGANGVLAEGDAVWVGNGDRGTLLRVGVETTGAAGALSTVASDCATLEGLDGLRADPRAPASGFIGTNNPKNTIVTITRTGQTRVIFEGGGLAGPADLATLGTSPLTLLVVSSSFGEAFAPADAGLVPKPALVKLTLP